MNESIYYNIDKLHSAIGEGKQIRFQYFQWTVEKKEALRRDGGGTASAHGICGGTTRTTTSLPTTPRRTG